VLHHLALVQDDGKQRCLADKSSLPLQVYLLGGVVTSWKMAGGDEVLYVRPDAKFDGCVYGRIVVQRTMRAHAWV
jgi:hypothetical protein